MSFVHPMTYIDFPNLLSELESRDTVFRMDFDDEQRREKAPFIMKTTEAEQKIWNSLFQNEISEATALAEITKLMEQYYGCSYPL